MDAEARRRSNRDRIEENLRFRRRALAIWTAVGVALLLYATSSRTPEGYDGPDPTTYVDPNSAPLFVLEALPGVGPVLGQRIVEARIDGRLERPEDLDLRVRGIGPATLKMIRPFLRFDSEHGTKSPAD